MIEPKTIILKQLKKEFSRFNQKDLILKLSSIQIYQPNQTQRTRIILASLIACSIKNSGNEKIHLDKLGTILNKYLPSDGEFGFFEETAENLFTDNIEFYQNNIIYLGFLSDEVYILSKLLKTIFDVNNPELKDLGQIINSKCTLLLQLSNLIATRSNHSRYMSSSRRLYGDIISDYNKIRGLTQNLIFKKDEIDMCELKDFIFNPTNDIPIDFETDLNSNPLLKKPFFELKNEIVLVVPSAITITLINYIWSKAQEIGKLFVLNKYYRKLLNKDMINSLTNMYYEEFILPSSYTKSKLFDEKIFIIDTDKVVYVSLIVDNAFNFNGNLSYIWEDKNVETELEEREKKFQNFILSSSKFQDFKILYFSVFGSIGRGSQIRFTNNLKRIEIKIHDLETISKSRHLKLDSLSLWKFLQAKENYPGQIGTLNSILDLITFFFYKGQSFYIDDEKPYTLINIEHGYGQGLRDKVKQINDIHLAEFDNDIMISMIRLDPYKDQPIYKSLENITHSLIVECIKPYIWVKSKVQFNHENYEIYNSFMDLLSYWLWQISPELKKHIDKLNFNTINITYSINNYKNWYENINITDFRDENINIINNIANNSIDLCFTEELISGFKLSNNSVERFIVRNLLKAFSEIQKINNLPLTLTDEIIEEILNLCVPLGLKRKLSFLNSSKDFKLSQVGLLPLRLIQAYDSDNQLNGLLKDLGIKVPETPTILTMNDKIKLLIDTRDFFINKLKKTLSNFNTLDLLRKLFLMNESCINQMAQVNLKIPTIINCFEKSPSILKEIMDDNKMLPTTNLAIRTIIEFIANEPPKGHKQPSKSDLDELISITHHLISFGMIAEQIRFKIFDHEISYLPSGRIGIVKDNFEKYWDPFMNTKNQEEVDSSIKTFHKYFDPISVSQNVNIDISDENKLFKAEFGLTLQQISYFLLNLSLLGDKNNSSICLSTISNIKNFFIHEINFSEEDIDNAIELFSLTKMELGDEKNEIFKKIDSDPWRYNRRLSLLRRPLVIIDTDESRNSLLCWGIRQTYQALENLISLIGQGRYKEEHCKSKEMKAFIGKVNHNKGTYFNNKAEKWFKEKEPNFFINKGVKINNKSFFKYLGDLGDIDLLVIDQENFIVYSIECKEINYARNSQEIANELEKFWEKDKAWVSKHIERHSYLETSLDIIFNNYNLSFNSRYKLISFILTSVEIPSTFIKGKNIGLPFISFTSLEKKGINLLKTLIK